MSTRDDFPAQVKARLAERVAYRCSFPTCGTLTVGPSDEGPSARSMVGVAAHISGAASGPGSRRYDPSLTPEDRRSIENGIWMCQTHGDLVDTDEVRFTVPMLKRWRVLAELRCRLELELGRVVAVDDLTRQGEMLIEHSVRVSGLGGENEIIGDALNDACLPLIWGPDITHAVRDFAIEWVRNAFQHGEASNFVLEVSPQSLRLTDDARPYSPAALAANGSGGGGRLAAVHLLTKLQDRVIVASRSSTVGNDVSVTFPTTASQLLGATPCSMRLDRKSIYHGVLDISLIQDCHIIYVILPPYFAISDIAVLKMVLFDKLSQREVVFVVRDASPLVREHIAVIFPQARTIELPD